MSWYINTVIAATNLQTICTSLCTDDLLNLDSLLIQLREHVTPRWYVMGVAIGLPQQLLDQYSAYPPEECVVEMFDYWLQNYSTKPTWEDVAIVLRKINLDHLANNIMKVYETG